MIPYADFLYFGILLYIALPTLLIRRLFGFSRAWVLLATAAMLIVQYGTIVHLVPVIAPEGVRVTGGSRAPGGLARVRDLWVVHGLRPLPVERGPGFPLDQDAHPLVLAVPRGDAVDPAPPDWRPDSCRWPSRAPTWGSWGSRT